MDCVTPDEHPLRGDVVTIAGPGDYTGKPRPALVVQADLFNETHGSVTVCLLTSTLVAAPLFRITVPPSADNGLRQPSQVMVDKLASVRREAIGRRLGCVDAGILLQVDRALGLWLGL